MYVSLMKTMEGKERTAFITSLNFCWTLRKGLKRQKLWKPTLTTDGQARTLTGRSGNE